MKLKGLRGHKRDKRAGTSEAVSSMSMSMYMYMYMYMYMCMYMYMIVYVYVYVYPSSFVSMLGTHGNLWEPRTEAPA